MDTCKVYRRCGFWYAAAGERAGGRISRSRSSDRVLHLSECADAVPGKRHWQRILSSEGTCEVWLLCETWSESASPTL